MKFRRQIAAGMFTARNAPSAAKWVEMIVDMAIENRPRVLNGLQTIKDSVWKAGVEACIKAVDDYKAWQETVAKKKSEKE
jgi:hypothetical protein